MARSIRERWVKSPEPRSDAEIQAGFAVTVSTWSPGRREVAEGLLAAVHDLGGKPVDGRALPTYLIGDNGDSLVTVVIRPESFDIGGASSRSSALFGRDREDIGAQVRLGVATARTRLAARSLSPSPNRR